jgi:hypothetical protein
MTYDKLVAISGLGGLFELISSRADGAVVRSLEDKSSKFVSNRMHNFSHLESIEIYTTGENKNLAGILMAMNASGDTKPDANGDSKAIRAYFEKLVPDMDFERVYASDMKKMLKWLELINKNNIEIKLSDTAPKEDAQDHAAQQKNTVAASGKPATVKSGPARKVNAPRKMA